MRTHIYIMLKNNLLSIMFQNENFFYSSHYVFCEKATRYYSVSISWSTTLVIGERGYELSAVNAIKRICSKIIHNKGCTCYINVNEWCYTLFSIIEAWVWLCCSVPRDDIISQLVFYVTSKGDINTHSSSCE